MAKTRLSAVTLGVIDFARSVRFYEDLGFERRFKATGDAIAFFDAGGMVLSLFRWDMLAEDAQVLAEPRPHAFRGMTLAQMFRTDAEVDAAMSRALAAGATLLKHAQKTRSAVIPAISQTRTVMCGKRCARRISNSARMAACYCPIERNQAAFYKGVGLSLGRHVKWI